MFPWIPVLVVDVVLLVARAALGVIFMAHGWHKLSGQGIERTQQAFRAAGVPLPSISALYTTFTELIAGAMLVLGALMPLAALLLLVNMAGAFLFVHVGKGLFVDKGGYEYVLTLGVTLLVLGAVGAGRLSVDGLLDKRKRGTPASRSH